MLQLESLVFQSDTKALEQAVAQIDNLASAVSRLNKAQQEETKTAIQSEKLKQEEAKTAQVLAKAKKSSVKANEEVEASSSKVDKLLKNLQNTYKDLANGMTRGESSTLNFARSLGATEAQIRDVTKALKDVGSLTKNPFDASLGAVRSITQEFGKLQHRVDLANQGIVLSTKQLGEYSRIATELAAKMTSAGMDISKGAGLEQFNNKLAETQKEYLGLAAQVNQYTAAEKELQRQHRESANAARALAAEEERMSSVMQSMNSGLNQTVSASEKSAMAIARYERNLRLAGVGAQEAAAKLALYKTQMLQVQEIEQTRRAQHLSRALTPQISDVITSIAGGMPLHLVIMQQGLQIRDLINLSGVEMGKLQEVFRTASADMIKSLAGTAKAIGTLLIGSLISAGVALRDGLIAPFKLTKEVLKDFTGVMQGNAQSIENLHKSYVGFGEAIRGMSRILMGIGVAALGAFAVAAVQVINANTEMSSSLIQFGAALGITMQEAQGIAASLTDLGVSYATGLRTVGEFAKSGIQNTDQLTRAIHVATYASEALGVDVKDLEKQYEDLKKKPVDALIEIAKNNGFVSASVIENVRTLVEQNKTLAANELAIEAVISAQQKMGDSAIQNLSPMQKLWRDIKQAFSEAWGTIQQAVSNLRIFDGLRIVFATIKLTIDQIVTGLKGISRIAAAIFTGNWGDIGNLVNQISDESIQDQQKFLDVIQDVQGANDKTQEQLKAEQQLRQKVYNDAITFEKQLEERKKSKQEAEKEANKITNAYNKTIDDFQKMQVKASGTTEELSKAQTHLLNVMRSEEWAKWTLDRRLAVLEEFKLAHAAELSAEAYKEQEKALKSLLKLEQEMNAYFLEQDTKIVEITSELEFQYSTLGKSENEVKKITRAYEEQKKINKINSDLQKEQLNYLQKYATEAGKLEGDELARAQENAINTLTQMQMKADEQISLARNESQLKSVQEYEQAWMNIKGGITDILYDSLSEGGKGAAKKIRQYIEEALKKKFILPAIDLVVNLVSDTGRLLLGAGLNLLTGGSSGGDLGTALGLVNSASSVGTAGGAVASVWSGAGALPYTESLASAYGAAGGDTVGAFINMNPQWSAAGQSFGEAASASLTKGTSAMTTSWANMANIAGAGLAAYGVGSYVGQRYGTVAGTAAGTLAGAGTYAAGSALATGASITSALAAIPGWGWVAAGVVALVGALGGKKPKLKGDVVGGEYSGDTFTVTGAEKVGKRSLSGEESLTAISEIFSGTFASLLKEFEQEVSFTTEALFRTRTSALGRFSLDGEKIAGQHNKRYSLEKLFNDVMSEGMYNAIQGSDLPDQIEALFDKSMDVESMAAAIAAVVNMNNALQEVGTDLTSFIGVMDFDAFRKEGEKNIDIVSRMVASVLQMNSVFEGLNFALFKLTSEGFAQIDLFKELLGGEETTSKLLQSYYENFFTEEEKRINLIKNLEQQLSLAGADIEKINIGEMTRLQYRELVESTIEVRGATDPLSIALLKLSSDFASLQGTVDDAAKSVEEANKAILEGYVSSTNKAFSVLKNSIEKEKNLLSERFQDESKILKDRIEGISNVIRTLDSAINNIESTVENVNQTSLQSARNALSLVIASVRSGADVGNFKDIIGESSSVLTKNTTSLYSTRSDFIREQRKSLNTLNELNTLSNDQLTSAEKQLALLEAWYSTEVAKLDNILEKYQKQIDVLRGNVEATLSVNDAIMHLEDAIVSEFRSLSGLILLGLQQGRTSPQEAIQQLQQSGVNVTPESWSTVQTDKGAQRIWASTGGAVALSDTVYGKTGSRFTIKEAVGFVNTALSNNDPLSVYTEAVKSGISSNSLDAMMGWSSGTASSWAKQNNLPAFATGGYYSGGLAMVGETGPELINFSNPGQVYTANQTANILSGDNSELIEVLTNEVQMLRAEARAIAINTSKAARILDDTSQGGTELRVVTIP